MAKKRKRAARIDLATEDMLLAEEDLAAMRPALAVAPELVVQTLEAARRRSARKSSRKRVTAKKKTAKKARKSAAKKKKARPAARKTKTARKK